MSFIETLNQKKQMCDSKLYAYFENYNCPHSNIIKAMDYTIKTGGKRLRMIMLMETAKLFTDKIEDAIPFGCAIEMIHAYSLVHDDLPAMDNSDTRRGKPTVHKKFNETTAILVGDGLLSHAYEIMTSYALKEGGKSQSYLQAINEIAKAAGINGMLLGQSIDVETENKKIELPLLKTIHLKKTAAMFIGAMKAGAIIGGADKNSLIVIEEYAQNFGLAFQITDDILDEIGDEQKLGKHTGSDKKNNKTTYSSLLGIEEARIELDKHIKTAIDIITPVDKNNFFVRLCDYISKREY